MKISLPEYDQSAIGGGWSFISNFRKVVEVTDYNDSDIFFIPSASMVSREIVEAAKRDGKKIVLRCDNVIRNSRNRNTGMSRMKDFSEMADLVIFQSRFAEGLLNPFLHTENYKVILNSVDEKIFNTNGRVEVKEPNRFLYAKHSSDETKNWEMARMSFQRIFEDEKDATLSLVGRFDGNLEEYNFDFYNGENFSYKGYVTNPHTMAEIYRNADWFIYTYFQDACSNTLIEALCCGVGIEDQYGMATTGGTPEIVVKFKDCGADYFFLDRMGKEYMEAFENVI